MKLFLVIDTNIWLSGLFFKGAPHELLQLLRHGRVGAYITQELIDELSEVLARKFLDRLESQGVSEADVLALVAELCVLLPATPKPFVSALRDVNDLHVLACVKASFAQMIPASAIITGDKDLLVLQKFEGVPILDANEWMKGETDHEQ